MIVDVEFKLKEYENIKLTTVVSKVKNIKKTFDEYLIFNSIFSVTNMMAHNHVTDHQSNVLSK